MIFVLILSLASLVIFATILRKIVFAIIGKRSLVVRMCVGAVLMLLLLPFLDTEISWFTLLMSAMMGAMFLAMPSGIVNIGSDSGCMSSCFSNSSFSSQSSGGGGTFGGGGSSGSW